MRVLGPLLRSALNINTVWGLMILISFVLCVAQHFLPTTTTISAAQLRDGDNALTIRITNANDQAKAHDFVLSRGAEGLKLPPVPAKAEKGRPRLVSAVRDNDGFAITWDSEDYGQYEVVVNGAPVSRGRLVTLQTLTDSAFDYAKKGFDIALGLVATMVLFLGLMKVGEDAGIVQLVAKVFHPIIRLIFPGVPRDHPASGAVLMNMTTGVLGLGNAATPFGLKAMKELETLNPHPGVATDAQVTLLSWNTGGLALLPTTLLAVRKAAGCSDPFEVIGTCLIGGATATIVAVLAARLLSKLPMVSVRAALAEETAALPEEDKPAAEKEAK